MSEKFVHYEVRDGNEEEWIVVPSEQDDEFNYDIKNLRTALDFVKLYGGWVVKITEEVVTGE